MHEDFGGYSSRDAGGAHVPGSDGRGRANAARRNAGSPRAPEGRAGAERIRVSSRDGAPAARTTSRAAARPSTRAGARPPSHSGRLPAQPRNARRSTSTDAPSRPRRAASAARGFERDAYPPPGDTPYRDRDRYRRITQKPERRGRRLTSLLIGLGAVAAVVLGVAWFVQSLPANITLNGASLEVHGGKTLGDALTASGIKPQPGDLLAVDGSVLEAGKGEPFHATVNGEVVTELEKKLSSGDVVEIGNGGPLEEPSDAVEEPIPWTIRQEGNGAIHLIEGEGKDGVKATKTGKISGITAEQVAQEPSDIVSRNVSPDVGDDKVIALTFDDGPWGGQTAQVLDVLAEHGAKATFFTVGNRIEQGDGAALVKRAAAEGHQICTHSYDHAAGSGQGVNLGYMSHEERKAEIEKGYAAIEAAIEGEASRIVRTPGGNFGDDVVKSIGPLIKAEIGWDIDSNDWRRPGPDAIAEQIEKAWPGAVVLLHDGGGDRAQTIDALKKALPRLKEQGYRFVTMDELLQYPLQ